MAGRRSAWRGLGLFWAALLAAGALAGGTLQALGPPARRAAMQAPASADRVPATPDPAARPAAAPPPEVPKPEPAIPAATSTRGPDPALLERAGDPPMQLPRRGPDGRLPRTVYAAPFAAPPAGTPRIAILLSSFGQSDKDSRAALDALPGPVSLGVSAYAGAPPGIYDLARAAGHELLASIPMEPQGFPLNDEGPHSLLTGLSPEENRRNLDWSLSRLPGEVGATAASDGMRGEAFADLPGAMDPILDEVARRGLLYVDPRPGHTTSRPGLAARTVDLVIDDSPSRAEIEAKLAALERIAREKGSAIGLASQVRPVTIDRLATWAQTLRDRGFALVPVSALVPPP